MLHVLFVYKRALRSINNFKHEEDNALNKLCLFKDPRHNDAFPARNGDKLRTDLSRFGHDPTIEETIENCLACDCVVSRGSSNASKINSVKLISRYEVQIRGRQSSVRRTSIMPTYEIVIYTCTQCVCTYKQVVVARNYLSNFARAFNSPGVFCVSCTFLTMFRRTPRRELIICIPESSGCAT